MFNNGLISTSNVGNLHQILADVSQQVSVGCIVPQDMGVQIGRRKIVKAGTPIHMDYLNPFEPVTEPIGGGGDDNGYEFINFAQYEDVPQYNKVTIDAEKFSAEIKKVCNDVNPPWYPQDFACGDWALMYVLQEDESLPPELYHKFILVRGDSDYSWENELYKVYNTYEELADAGITIANHDDMQAFFLMSVVAIPAGTTLEIVDHTPAENVSITGDRTSVLKTLLAKLTSHDYITSRSSKDDTKMDWLSKFIYSDKITFEVIEVTGSSSDDNRYKSTMKYHDKNGWHEAEFYEIWSGESEKFENPLIVLSTTSYSWDDGEETGKLTLSHNPLLSVGDTIDLVITHEGNAGGGASDGVGEFNAVLLHDVDVTLGANNGTALLFGVVNVKRVEDDTREKIESNLEDSKNNKSHVVFISA